MMVVSHLQEMAGYFSVHVQKVYTNFTLDCMSHEHTKSTMILIIAN